MDKMDLSAPQTSKADDLDELEIETFELESLDDFNVPAATSFTSSTTTTSIL